MKSDVYCDECDEEIGYSSHYHCSYCHKVCGMQGHQDCYEKATKRELCPKCNEKSVITEADGVACATPNCGYWLCYS